MKAADLKVGDVVTTKVVIEKVNYGTARVHTSFIDGRADISFWVDMDDIEPVNDRTQPVKPAKKYQVGDEVIHINRPQMGIGKIVTVIDTGKTYSGDIDNSGEIYGIGKDFPSDYEVDWQFHPLSEEWSAYGWTHAEEFLLPARRKEN